MTAQNFYPFKYSIYNTFFYYDIVFYFVDNYNYMCF